MRITFRAHHGFCDQDGDVLSAGLDTGEDWDTEDSHYVCFQRGLENPGQKRADWEKDGLHFEFDDQIHGNYGVVRQCRLNRSMLSVDLSERLEELDNVDGFDVVLAIDDETYEQLKAGLPQIFDGTSARLLLG